MSTSAAVSILVFNVLKYILTFKMYMNTFFDTFLVSCFCIRVSNILMQLSFGGLVENHETEKLQEACRCNIVEVPS